MKKLMQTILDIDANSILVKRHGVIVKTIVKKHYHIDDMIRLKKLLAPYNYVWEIMPADKKVIIQAKHCSIKIYVK